MPVLPARWRAVPIRVVWVPLVLACGPRPAGEGSHGRGPGGRRVCGLGWPVSVLSYRQAAVRLLAVLDRFGPRVDSSGSDRRLQRALVIAGAVLAGDAPETVAEDYLPEGISHSRAVRIVHEVTIAVLAVEPARHRLTRGRAAGIDREVWADATQQDPSRSPFGGRSSTTREGPAMVEENELEPLPVATLLEELIGDTSSDYADGDHPGYFRHVYNPETGTLHVHYEHSDPNDVSEVDEDADDADGPSHGPAVYRFQLIAPLSGEPGDWERKVRASYQDELNDGESHRSAILRVLHAARTREASDTELGSITRVLLGIEDED